MLLPKRTKFRKVRKGKIRGVATAGNYISFGDYALQAQGHDLIAQGAHPKEIQALLGHSTIVQTMDTYGHLFDDSRRELAAKMDALLGPAKG